jgi:hypothetical protein
VALSSLAPRPGMDAIVKGALRLAVQKVLDQRAGAFGGMHCERVIEQGIKPLVELKRPRGHPNRNLCK